MVNLLRNPPDETVQPVTVEQVEACLGSEYDRQPDPAISAYLFEHLVTGYCDECSDGGCILMYHSAPEDWLCGECLRRHQPSQTALYDALVAYAYEFHTG